VNKTAIAIKEIIAGLQGKEQSAAPVQMADNTVKVSVPFHPPKRTVWKFRLPTLDKTAGLILTVVILMVSLLALTVFHFSQTEPESKTYRYTIPPPEKTTYRTDLGGHISPDGNLLAFVAVDSAGISRLWVRALNSLTTEALNATEGATYPFWSPDSRSIGFFADGKLKKIAASGGLVQTLCNAPNGRGGAWGIEGTIIFSGNFNAPVSRVPETGGAPQAITKLDTIRKEMSHRWPCFLTDGQHFFYLSRLAGNGVSEGDAIFLASLDTTELPTMMVKASSNVGYANGHLLFAQGATLMAKTFDTHNFESVGDAFPVVEKVDFSSAFSRAPFSVSQNGVLVYQAGSGTSSSRLTWRDRTGKLVGAVGNEASFYFSLRISPDGGSIATAQPDGNGGQIDIALVNINRAVQKRFTFDKGIDLSPVWSPNGKTILFASNRNKNFNLYQRPSTGEDAEQLLFQSNEDKFPSDWSRDGKFLAYEAEAKANSVNDIWILPIGYERRQPTQPFVFLQTEFNEMRATFSPDGRWIAYQSDESGRYEVYIRPFPGPGGKWQVSSGGGTRPRWRGDGKELFYMTEGDYKLMSVEVKPGPSTIEVGSAQVLFANRMVSAGPRADLYDETQDGRLFLVETAEGGGVQAPITLVVNWVGEIKKK
jgi:Tol biopolymer transport system component